MITYSNRNVSSKCLNQKNDYKMLRSDVRTFNYKLNYNPNCKKASLLKSILMQFFACLTTTFFFMLSKKKYSVTEKFTVHYN